MTISGACSIVNIVLSETEYSIEYATVAQLVEYDLAKVGVAGSSPVCRSLSTLEECF